MAPDTWRRSSYSGSGDGNNCVEVAPCPTHIFIRDSKDPTRAPLAFRPHTFAVFLDALQTAQPRATSSASNPSSFSRYAA
ncbi:DUF397 domain-containing protein [Streptomyces sp. NPDC048291]|uniref:DUF397 domain-containing protein n=1 Tax=Streptomyces sp. NPDC048291 TaxID=3365530 RepID=UPI00371DC0D1